MTSHVHPLLTPKRAEAAPRLVILLGRRYVQYTNRSYRPTGTPWESRYKSSSVQAETFLLACQRYIELNPVRAAMLEDPAHYRWGSYRANGLGQADTRLTSYAASISRPHGSGVRTEVVGVNRAARRNEVNHEWRSHTRERSPKDDRTAAPAGTGNHPPA
jgi:hypothetical protein